jgi:hypothetical protein
MQTVNAALLLIQGFELSEHLRDSLWTLFTSHDIPTRTPPPTFTPLADGYPNAFAGLSFAEVNAFLGANGARLEPLGFMLDLWLIIDQAGLATRTGVVCKQRFSGGDEDDAASWGYARDEFDAMRVPLDQAWAVYSNLTDQTHPRPRRYMEMPDYWRGGSDVQVDGTERFNEACREEVTDPEVLARKEKAWRTWREKGYVE